MAASQFGTLDFTSYGRYKILPFSLLFLRLSVTSKRILFPASGQVGCEREFVQ